MRPPRSVALVAGGLAIGAAFHAVDVIHYGWWPYAFGPAPLNLFWNLLLPLDLGLIALLAWRWRAGLVTTAMLMVADVTVNAYAWLILGFDAFAGAVPVQVGFAAAVLALAWRYRAGGPFTTG